MCSTFNSLSATSTQMNALIYSAQAIIYHCYIKNTVEIPIISSYSIQLVSNNIASSKGSLTSPNSDYFKINIIYNNTFVILIVPLAFGIQIVLIKKTNDLS